MTDTQNEVVERAFEAWTAKANINDFVPFEAGFLAGLSAAGGEVERMREDVRIAQGNTDAALEDFWAAKAEKAAALAFVATLEAENARLRALLKEAVAALNSEDMTTAEARALANRIKQERTNESS